MGNWIYAHPDDDRAKSVTPTLDTGYVESGSSIADLTDRNPAHPFIASSTALRFVWDFGSPVRIYLAALFHTNIDGAAAIQANPSSSWGSPAHDQAFTMPSADEDEFRDDPWIEISTATAYRFWSLSITGNTGNIRIGDFWLADALRRPTHGPGRGVVRGEERAIISHKTQSNVGLYYDLGVRQRSFEFKTVTSRATGLPLYQSLFRATRGPAKPFPIIFDDLVNRAYLVRFEDPILRVKGITAHMVELDVRLTELSRGLSHPDSAPSPSPSQSVSPSSSESASVSPSVSPSSSESASTSPSVSPSASQSPSASESPSPSPSVSPSASVSPS